MQQHAQVPARDAHALAGVVASDQDIALEMIAALSAIAPRMVVDVPPELPTDVVITRNGQVVPISSYGLSQKLDPGEYELSASQAGRAVWRRHVSLAPRDRVRVEIPVSAAWVLPTAPTRVSDVAQHATQPGAVHEPPPRRWMVLAGSAAVAGLGCGIAAGAVAWSEQSTIDQHCREGVCDREGQRAVGWARRTAVVSTVGFAVGLAGAAAATMLFVRSKRSATHPPDRAHSPRLKLQPALGVGRAPVIGVVGAF